MEKVETEERRTRPQPWSLRIKTFSRDYEDNHAFDIKPRPERSGPDVREAKPRELANAFRGCVVGMRMAVDQGWAEEFEFLLVRAQELFAESMRRDPHAHPFSVAYESSDRDGV